MTAIPVVSALLLAGAFTERPQDSNGWTVFTPSADTRIMYVSTNGTDATATWYAPTNGVIGVDPFAPTGAVRTYRTVAAASAQARSGYPDWILLRRGQAWYELLNVKDGRSPLAQSLVGAYGDGAARPILKAASNTALSVCCSWRTNFAVAGIHFYAHTRDTNSPEYVSGLGNPGVRVYCGAGAEVAGVLIEDCMFSYFLIGIDIEGEGTLHDIVIRRNVIHDSYSESSHSQGMYASHASVLVEENDFDHNGWLIQGIGDNNQAGGAATFFNHNTYLGSCSTTTFRGNLFLRGASMNNKWRADETGSSRNILIDDNLYAEGEIGIGIGGNTTNPLRFVDVTIVSNVMVDIGRERPTGRTLAWYLDIADWDGGSVVGNLFLHQTNTVVGNTYAVNFSDPNRNLTLAHNLVHQLYTGGALMNFGANSSNVCILQNAIQSPSNAAKLVSATSVAGCQFASNTYWSAISTSTWFTLQGTNCSLAVWAQRAGEIGAEARAIVYPYPDRTVESYAQTLGVTGSIGSFTAEVRKQSKQTWRPEYMAHAVNEYIRRGFEVLSIPPSNPPLAGLNAPYAWQFAAHGGGASFTWNVVSGELPPGLTLATNGLLAGTPTAMVTRVVTVGVQDDRNGSDQRDITVMVVPEPVLLALVGAALALVGRRMRRTCWEG